MNGNSGNEGISSSFCFHSKKKQQPVKSISLQTRHDLPVWWWKRWNGSDTSEYEAWALPTLHGCNVIGRVRKGREGRVWWITQPKCHLASKASDERCRFQQCIKRKLRLLPFTKLTAMTADLDFWLQFVWLHKAGFWNYQLFSINEILCIFAWVGLFTSPFLNFPFFIPAIEVGSRNQTTWNETIARNTSMQQCELFSLWSLTLLSLPRSEEYSEEYYKNNNPTQNINLKFHVKPTNINIIRWTCCDRPFMSIFFSSCTNITNVSI